MRTRQISVVLLVTGFIALGVAQSVAQQRDDQDSTTYQERTRAVDESDSRAQKEADRMVSLPPERIILMLQEEPGLFLEIKKMLVRKAYEQGRVLESSELTDEAIFRLIQEDEEIRSLITQQIVDRGYIKAKPTQEEVAKQFEEQQRLLAKYQREPRTDYEEANSEDNGTPLHQYQQRPGMQPASPYAPGLPMQNQQPAPPQNPNNTNQQRTLMQAAMQEGGAAESGGLPFDAVTGSQQQLSPEQIQQLISAYGKGGLAGPNGQPDVSKLASVINGNSGNAAAMSTTPTPQSQEEAYLQSQPSLSSPTPLNNATNGSSPFTYNSAARPLYPRRPPDEPRLVHRANPYADVPSLYDLYSQYSRRQTELRRFGMDIFETGTGNFDQLPMDLPAGPDYVLGPGDGVNIDLWGSVSQRLHRVVDRQGRLSLPEIGSIQAAGHTMADVQHMVQNALRSQFRQLEADISLDRLRTIRVYVVGDVQRPGAYDISSLSTPLNALYQAGGPTSRGSMRIVKHYRGNQLVEDVDLYDLLLHGVQAGMQRLESGDSILIPPVGKQVTIEGMVRRPAIYELAGESSLSQVLELAGGVLPSGTLRHVDVERVESHQDRTMLRVDMPETNDSREVNAKLESFTIQDGDKVRISPILPFADKTVYLDGHVFRPGKYAYRDGMKVTDLIRSYSDMLPEPYNHHAEVIRLNGPDLRPQVIAFNLGEAMQGKDQDLLLKPFDTVRIFGRFDFEDPPIVTVTGEVRDPGDHVTNGVTHLRDAVMLAGNVTPDAQLDDVQVFRKTSGGKVQVINADLAKALAGSEHDNIVLQPQDRVFIHKDTHRIEPATVQVEGEVARPGKYLLGQEMTATDLVRLAGGVKRSAYLEAAELTRYTINQDQKLESEHLALKLGAALSGEPDSDMRLHAGDVLTIKQMAGWHDIGATVLVDGAVVHPGTYGIQEGERLSDVLARAGGFRSDAYPYGAIFERVEIRRLEEKNRAQLIAQTKQEGGGLGSALEDPVGAQASLAQWHDTLQKLQATPPAGRMVIHINNGKSWIHSPADVQLRAGDSVYIPKKPNFVMVQGSVYNQTAIAFRPGKSASWYLHQAGGATSGADKKNIFVVRADGTVNGGPKGLFSGGALDAAMQPGDMIVVPAKAVGGGFKWRETLQVAQLVSAVGIAVQVARGF